MLPYSHSARLPAHPDASMLLDLLWLVKQLCTGPGFVCEGARKPGADNQFPKPIENDVLNSTRSHRLGLAFHCNSALTLRAFKTSKTKNLKRSNFGQSVFFRAQNALCSKTGGAIIGLLVSKQDGMVFSSSPTCLSLVRVNQPIPTQF